MDMISYHHNELGKESIEAIMDILTYKGLNLLDVQYPKNLTIENCLSLANLFQG